jgi:MoaC family
VRTADRTGVEMQALTGVAVAALAVIDMVKGIDIFTAISDVRPVAESGGRSGGLATRALSPAPGTRVVFDAVVLAGGRGRRLGGAGKY